ncbi:hypothetical protein LIPSTDRAFT_276929 [Lipomyces starkeyi NRRL Y-11557]|uniref:DUF4219 domain-containing protein n=1 Tax=Lipomyces starkeyi NRRL Y-11557 TaxID=675824 RepID=A0A1E3QA27_LIPST|nr:hypothetical protein LIPSTDRAFT_276929 [Lipomyces starkeyi NRRL Y-11557]
MVKFDGKNYRQWAMYMEALFMHKGTWDVVSGTGMYNPHDFEDATIIVKKNNLALLDLIVTLGNQEPGLLATKDAQHIWKSMENRYQQTLTRLLALVNTLFTWKCQSDQNVDKWVQESCDVLKEFLNLQVNAEDFWKVVMINNLPPEFGGAITSLGSIENIAIREIGARISERLWGIKNA